MVSLAIPVQLLRLLCNLQLLSFLFYQEATSVFALIELSRRLRTLRAQEGEGDIPKSAMLKTPDTLELARRLASLGGLEDRPWTAESTLDKGAGAASADMVGEGLYS